MALSIKIADSAAKYLQSLDAKNRKRIADKLQAIGENPNDWNLAKPLSSSDKRSARVGEYRILLQITATDVFVVDIGPRGQIYRRLKRR